MRYALSSGIRTEVDGQGAVCATHADFDAMKRTFSIAGWVRPMRVCANGAVLARGDFTQSSCAWSFNVSVGSSVSYAITSLYLSDTDVASADVHIDPTIWNHIVWTMEHGGALHCYVNGVESTIATTPQFPAYLQESTDAVKLCDTTRAHACHLGVWTRALTDAEVLADFGLDRETRGCVAWWPCTDDFGNDMAEIFGRHDAVDNGGTVYRTGAALPADAPSTVVCFLGDQTVIGTDGAPDDVTGWRRAVTWGADIDERGAVAMAIGNFCKGKTFTEVCHSGVAGDAIADVDTRRVKATAGSPTDIVLAVGVNDLVAGYGAGFKTGLTTLLGHLRAISGVKRIFVLNIPPSGATWSADVASANADIASVVAGYTTTPLMRLVDVYTGFDVTNGKANDTNPNGLGYDFIAAKLVAAIKSAWGTAKNVPSKL